MEAFTDSMDLVLGSIQCVDEPLIYQKENNFIYLFRTSKRKRRGQLNKFCERYLEEKCEWKIKALTKKDFDEHRILIQKSGFKKISETERRIEYEGKDLEKFQNPENWRKWQLEIYRKLFNEQKPTKSYTDRNNWSIKQADERKIINIVDKVGKSGKSQFFKYLYIKNQKSIGRISYGSAAQLRSSLVNLGEKKIYIIDLPRTRGKSDSQDELLSVLEELKSGCVINAMYGRGNSLIIEPPHIIVSTNYLLSYENLSRDRWEVFEIDSKNQKLGPKNRLLEIYKEEIRKMNLIKKQSPDLLQLAGSLPKQ